MGKQDNVDQKRDKRKRLFMIMLILLIMIFAVFFAMQHSTDAMIREIEEACLSDDYYVREEYLSEFFEKYSKPGIIYIPYGAEDRMTNIQARFSFRYNVELSGNDDFHKFQLEVKVTRKFAWHNFRRGYLWIAYTRAARDSEGRTVTGSWNIPVKIAIEWKNGKWVPTRMWEAP